jgi:hypothetical protein
VLQHSSDDEKPTAKGVVDVDSDVSDAPVKRT